MRAPVIEIRGFGMRYGRSGWAVRELDLSVPPGCVHLLLGSNGAGKSTTVLFTANLLPGAVGELRLFGEKIAARQYRFLRRTGYQLENHPLLPKLTGREYLLFCGQMFGCSFPGLRVRAEQLLRSLQMERDLDRRIEHYSFGMRKKLALASALIHEPELLVLDDPFTGVDRGARLAIRERMAAMTASGGTVLLTACDVEGLDGIYDSAAVLEGGRVVRRIENKKTPDRG